MDSDSFSPITIVSVVVVVVTIVVVVVVVVDVAIGGVCFILTSFGWAAALLAFAVN